MGQASNTLISIAYYMQIGEEGVKVAWNLEAPLGLGCDKFDDTLCK